MVEGLGCRVKALNPKQEMVSGVGFMLASYWLTCNHPRTYFSPFWGTQTGRLPAASTKQAVKSLLAPIYHKQALYNPKP